MSFQAYQPHRPARRERIRLRGIETSLYRWGRAGGPLLVLLHGWMDCGQSFQFMLDAAPDALLQYDIVAPDWRGFGEADWAAESYYFPDYLADLDALLAQLAPTAPVVLLGHSMGGMVACLYAGIRPERVGALISLEGFGLPACAPAQAPARYRRWLDEMQSAPLERVFADHVALALRLRKANPRLGEALAAWLACQLGQVSGEGVGYRADPRHRWVNPVLYRLEEVKACWREVRAPTLWLAGDEARLLGWLGESPQAFAERKACFADLRYQVLADSGHNLHHDAPAALAEAVSAFLRAVDAD